MTNPIENNLERIEEIEKLVHLKKLVNGESDEIYVKLLTPSAKVPTKGSIGAAGYDLYSDDNVTVPPHKRVLVKTGIAIALPYGTYGRIADRSGMAYKKGVTCMGGVIDEDYRGEIGVILYNTEDTELVIEKGDRIAQMVVEYVVPVNCKVVDGLPDTDRGDGAFGSTGTK